MTNAKYQHDCLGCIHLGQSSFNGGDLYYCANCDGGTILCRFSSNAGDYWSMPWTGIKPNLFEFRPFVREAVYRAAELGLIQDSLPPYGGYQLESK